MLKSNKKMSCVKWIEFTIKLVKYLMKNKIEMDILDTSGRVKDAVNESKINTL